MSTSTIDEDSDREHEALHEIAPHSRRNSNPSSMFRPHLKHDARRINSLLPQKRQAIVHSSHWIKRTQALLKSLRLESEATTDDIETIYSDLNAKRKLSRVSSRLTSHHSSSSEEWYNELKDLPEADVSEKAESVEKQEIGRTSSVTSPNERNLQPGRDHRAMSHGSNKSDKIVPIKSEPEFVELQSSTNEEPKKRTEKTRAKECPKESRSVSCPKCTIYWFILALFALEDICFRWMLCRWN